MGCLSQQFPVDHPPPRNDDSLVDPFSIADVDAGEVQYQRGFNLTVRSTACSDRDNVLPASHTQPEGGSASPGFGIPYGVGFP